MFGETSFRPTSSVVFYVESPYLLWQSFNCQKKNVKNVTLIKDYRNANNAKKQNKEGLWITTQSTQIEKR